MVINTGPKVIGRFHIKEIGLVLTQHPLLIILSCIVLVLKCGCRKLLLYYLLRTQCVKGKVEVSSNYRL